MMKIDTPGDFVVGLKNGRLYCSDVSNIAPISQDGYVLEEVSFQWGDERIDPAKSNKVFKIRGFIRPRVYKAKVFSLLSGGGAKYFIYHWMLETVPKMYLFQKSGELDSNSYFIVPNKQLRYQREFLQHFGIDDDHIIDEESIHHVQADWLYLTSHIKYFDHHPRWSCDFLYDSMVRNSTRPHRRIFISRGDAHGKRVAENEKQLEEMLRRYGFESLQLSQFSIYEQAEVFNSASIIVAVHGGGLSNLVFCQPGTEVIEIFPDQYVPHIYYDIADKRCLRYHYLLFPSTGKATDAIGGQEVGLVVDVARVESKVMSLLPMI
jgi:capsular polysaccharide biosynthesis protein